LLFVPSESHPISTNRHPPTQGLVSDFTARELTIIPYQLPTTNYQPTNQPTNDTSFTMNSNYTGPIIQGTAVPAPGSIPSNNNNNNYGNPKETYHASTAGETYYNDTGGYSASASAVPFAEQYSHHQQQQQPNQFRDVFWAIAFLIHLGVMIVLISTNLAGQNGNDNGGDDNGGGAGVDAYGGTIVFVALSVLVSMGLSTSTISLMMKFPAGMVKLGLIFSAFVSGVFALLLLSSGSGLGMILGIFFFAITVCYVCSVWNRIPYAAGESFWFGGWMDGFDGSMNE